MGGNPSSRSLLLLLRFVFVALPSIYRVKSGTNCEWLHHTSRIQFIGPFFFPVFFSLTLFPAMRYDWLVSLCVWHGTAWNGRAGGGGAVYEWIFGFDLEPFYWHAETSLRWWRWYIFIPRSHVHIKKFEFEFKNVILWIIPRHVTG